MTGNMTKIDTAMKMEAKLGGQDLRTPRTFGTSASDMPNVRKAPSSKTLFCSTQARWMARRRLRLNRDHIRRRSHLTRTTYDPISAQPPVYDTFLHLRRSIQLEPRSRSRIGKDPWRSGRGK
ncbi:hypothetical protein [Streptomyces sp. NPDC051684]|uniref:hypothetical protein n=1 Tax=Streptomyces sp. NPDC051684 TaxID=3365670 RepID=UPI0037BB97E2